MTQSGRRIALAALSNRWSGFPLVKISDGGLDREDKSFRPNDGDVGEDKPGEGIDDAGAAEKRAMRSAAPPDIVPLRQYGVHAQAGFDSTTK